MENFPQAKIETFDRSFFDRESNMCLIGHGEIGGKAQGLASINSILSKMDCTGFEEIRVGIPKMVILTTSVFDSFMQNNQLYEIAYSDSSDDRISYAFQKADLPFEVLGDLRALMEQAYTPLAVRSSGLLEDKMHEPFAGVYSTKLIPNNQYDPDIRFRKLAEAIKFVYASTFLKTAKDYCKATGLNIKEEKMAVIIQELVGKRYTDRFYPQLCGVARSYNYYPLRPAKPEDGVVNLALGLGKTIVDGGVSWAYSPAYPTAEPPFGSAKELLKNTQSEFWVVNMGEPPEYDPIKETEYMRVESIVSADRDDALHYLASTYNTFSGRFSPGVGNPGPRALTFSPLLVLKEIPFNKMMIAVLKACEKTFNAPVEIEFAMTFDPHRFGFLQVRPLVVPIDELIIEAEELTKPDVIIASESVLGNGVIEGIRDIVYVKPESFELKVSKPIAAELEQINDKLLAANSPYLLIVFGRLGTVDPWLGIPVTWGQVCGARVIVEATQENVKVELSQGSHYFHNIINLGVKYFSMPFTSPYKIDWNWLNGQETVDETQYIRHVKVPSPLKITVDGRNGRGVVCKS